MDRGPSILLFLQGNAIQEYQIDGSDNYRIRLNAINTPQNSGILAESQQFSVVQGGPDPAVSVSVVDGTSTVVFGTPTATAPKTTSSGTPAFTFQRFEY